MASPAFGDDFILDSAIQFEPLARRDVSFVERLDPGTDEQTRNLFESKR